ncbi:MAG: alpha/beta hydrolase [Chloroflexi bacterium]|nr:alpha/beta hydrolase [Chloroflexota bacterium]
MRSIGQSAVKLKGLPMLGIWIVITIAGVYLVFAGFLFIFQSHYIYYPERVLSVTPHSIGLQFESVSFETTDGVQLSGWFVPSKSARGVILFCHGNAGNISHRLDSIQIFHQLGLDVFIFDYRGYGQSEGKPTEQGTYKDAEAAWRYLIEERQVKPNEVIIFGRSLGGAVASWLAQSHTPGALILESTFTSLPDIAAGLYPYLPVRLLLRFEYNTAEYLGRVDCPVLIVHSRDDEIMPFDNGQKLFESAKEPKKFLETTGTHNNGFITSGKRYEDGLHTFISQR